MKGYGLWGRHRFLVAQIALLVMMMASLVLVPASAFACGHSLARLSDIDLSHPPDPCVDAQSVMVTAVSSILGQMATIGLPGAIMMSVTIFLTFRVLFLWVFPRLLALSPPTPPPKTAVFISSFL